MRVLVTRPADQAARTVKNLAARGHHALVAPVLEIVPTGATPPDGPFDLVLATSAQAFAARRGLARQLRAAPVACVGDMTAQAAREAGFAVTFVAPRAEALADRLIAEIGSARALYLAGRERKPLLEERLGAAGWGLVVVETYAAQAVAHWPDEVKAALDAGMIDAALHYSPRSARLALSLMGADAAARLSHFCLSGEVAAVCESWVALERIFTPSQPDEEALMSLLGSVEPLRGE